MANCEGPAFPTGPNQGISKKEMAALHLLPVLLSTYKNEQEAVDRALKLAEMLFDKK